jgi:signal transduction histidine kinase
VEVFNDSIAWRRIFLYLILLVVVPTILLTLYGVRAINYLSVAVEADLAKRYERQSQLVEHQLLRRVFEEEQRLAKAVRGVPREGLQAALDSAAQSLPLVAEAWVVAPEGPNADFVDEVMRKGAGDPSVLVSLDIGDEVQVFGMVHETEWAVWRLDAKALQVEILPSVMNAVAGEDDLSVATYRIRTKRPAVSMTRSIQQTIQQLASDDPIVDRPMTPPLDRWYLSAYPSDLEVTQRIGSTRGFYVGGMVLLVGAVITGVSLTGRALFREMRLSQLQTDFVSNVSHELRTPLTSIRMFIETLQSGRVRDPVRMQECLDVVSQESERLSRMIERILGWARMEAGRRIYSFEPVPPDLIVRRALDAFRTQQLQDSDAQVVVEVDPNLRPVRADLEAVTEALLNLLNNAWKYTGTDKRISIRALPDRAGIGIEVSDNGPGIPKGERKRVFEKFYRADMLLTRRTQGSGLGLAIVRAIAQAHQGRVELESEEGRGSRFTLWLRYA